MPPFAAITLLSAFLLFLVQPLIARAILPWFGGAPAVWTTAMLFFQSFLLAGYAYAHGTARLEPRRRSLLHGVVLLASLVVLPIIPADSWRPAGTESPVWRILALLTATVGAPYLVLATTAPLLQDWYSRIAPTGTPYRLYAWSNAGSLAALLAYPFIVEPLLPVNDQARWWSVGYAAFVIGCGWITFQVARRPRTAVTATSAPPVPSLPVAEVALWFGLAACGSGLLLGITNQLSLDVAAVPFLWIAPLAVYLVTFILAFSGRYHRGFWRIAYLLSLGGMAALVKLAAGAPLAAQAAGTLFALFAACMLCHGELARRAPATSRLTAFYLTLAGGGAAGGVFVGLVAPVVFDDFWELPILLLLPYGLLLAIQIGERHGEHRFRLRPAYWVALAAVVWLGVTAFVLPALRGPRRTVATARNFYGVLHVADDPPAPGAMRRLQHGRIVHGTQFTAPERREEPTAYYARTSGVDLALTQHPRRRAGQPLRVAAVGLGAGTIATYGQPGDTMRFYEINPDVVQFALEYFTFLKDSHATVEVVLGDGRLSLERELASEENRHRYDVLVLDAFSGDAIPVHLLTLEAVAQYWTALKPDGVLAVHVSNRHLDLSRVVMGAARTFRTTAARFRRGPGAAAISSTWMLVAGDARFFHELTVPDSVGTDVPEKSPVIWTDQYSNLLQVLQ